MADKEIYALFRYYGDGMMVEKDFLCIKHGTPEEILNWLLNEGYLTEVYSLGQIMGSYSDKPYLDAIEKLMRLSSVSVRTIEKIDLRMPSCCTCCAVNKSFKDMGSFRDRIKALIAQPIVGTVMQGDDLNEFLELLDNACSSKESYTEFAYHLPGKYL